MSSQASGLRVASVIFALFAIGHVVRLVKQAQVTVGTYQIPMWVSVVALIIAAILQVLGCGDFPPLGTKSKGVEAYLKGWFCS